MMNDHGKDQSYRKHDGTAGIPRYHHIHRFINTKTIAELRIHHGKRSQVNGDDLAEASNSP